MDCQPAAVPEAIMERNEEQYRARPNRKQKRVTFLQATTNSQEFESVCTRQQDGTIDMKPANLARMCTILTGGASLPYRQNKKAARYHMYATRDIKLPAKSAVEVDLGY